MTDGMDTIAPGSRRACTPPVSPSVNGSADDGRTTSQRGLRKPSTVFGSLCCARIHPDGERGMIRAPAAHRSRK
jgi:hypothetical protein